LVSLYAMENSDKNLMQEAVSTSHGDMLMVSKDSVSDTAFRYEYQNSQPCNVNAFTLELIFEHF